MPSASLGSPNEKNKQTEEGGMRELEGETVRQTFRPKRKNEWSTVDP